MIILKKLTLTLLTIFALVAIAFPPSAQAADLENGAQLFEIHCVGCHANGGNIIRRGKGLSQSALQRNHMDSLEAIQAIVANGKSPMSAYKDQLTPEDIADVSTYVLHQSQSAWESGGGILSIFGF